METKHTPGPWFYKPSGICAVSGQGIGAIHGDGKNVVAEDVYLNDAALIIEAYDVAHETGLTPRQLVEQNRALVAALERLHVLTRGLDESKLGGAVSEAQEQARAALAAAKK